MRTLHLVASLDKSAGGPSRSVPQTCEQLALLGNDIVLISKRGNDPVKINSTSNLG